MRVLVSFICPLILLWSCQPDRAGPIGPDPVNEEAPAAKFVVTASVSPDPAYTDFTPFGTWKPFHVSANLPDLNILWVVVNPVDLANDRVLEIAPIAPQADY